MNKNIHTVIFLAFIIVQTYPRILSKNTSSFDSWAYENDRQKDSDQTKGDTITIKYYSIGIPLGLVALVRCESKYYAIKFSSLQKGKMAAEAFAKYEFYILKNITKDGLIDNYSLQKSKLSFLQPLEIPTIIGHGFRLPRGNPIIKSRSIKIQCYADDQKPSMFFSTTHYRDVLKEPEVYNIEIALTKWSEISQVNVFDKRLKWFGRDRTGKRAETILVSDIW